ncbi:MAG: terminase small subunit [Curvibacter lanceolatus]|uniref:terminase small subunit n=1 Tax=Curvibacter lanceolatus TaxID=86182 RepID=UPI002354098F|nr:terminase small subunit [Curvibacter lanceolatus]MBV5291303.1 terminase small subunit [Curvibacter lanceolatus]
MTDQDLTLTQKQERFCIEYLATGNSRESYRRAYDVDPGTLPSTITKSAYELMQRPEVKARIIELRAEVAEAAVIDQAQLLVELRRVAFSDIRRVMDASGKILIPSELDAETAAAVQSFKIDEFGRIEYKFHDKLGALEKLAKYLGLYEKDNRQKADPLVELLRNLSGNVVGAVRSWPEVDDDDGR